MTKSILSLMSPVEITDSVFTSSTAPEADYAAYNGATVYALGDRVIVISTHKIYESAQAGNTGHTPVDVTNIPTWWLDVSATNRWKMFDREMSTQTVIATPLTTVIEPGFINSLYCGALIGDTATITMKDAPGGTEVYNGVITLEASAPLDYYEHFFDPFQQLDDFILDDLPPYSLCELTVTISSASGDVYCGMLQVGDLRPLGLTSRDAVALPKTYSYIDIDIYGNNTTIPGKHARDMNVEALVDLDYADTCIAILGNILDIPTLVVADIGANYSGLRCFGLVSGQLKYDDTNKCILSLSVKGLI